ncbi:hypothetical protein [Lysobacter sp. F6437]|uniref:hypothetical protein n=1 Tax=Lysobacter sp. F6437 TaxID=3459296 RepID=UPI00403DB5B1
MGTIIRRLLAALLVTAVVWFAVVLYWQVAEVSPGAGDLALWLLGLPLALLGAFLLLRWGLRRRAARAATPAATGDQDESASPIDSGPQPDRIVHLLAGAAWLRAGAGGAAIAEALVKPERPSLHPRLKDSLGLPAFAAAVEDLDPAAIEAPLRAVMAEPETFDRVFDQESLRAIALLDPVAEELLLAALPPISPEAAEHLAAGHAGLHPHAMHHSRSARAPTQVVAVVAVLRVRLLLPAAWAPAVRQAAGEWLRAKAAALGFVSSQLEVEVLPVAGGSDSWRILDHLIQVQARDRDDDPQLLLAAHSAIGDASIERLDARRELLVSGHPEGLIPGEGAAGLLLVGAHVATDPAAPAPLRLHRLLRGQAGSGRGASRQAAELLQHAMTTAAQPAESIAVVFSDADHRPSRAIEIAGAIAATLPELDPVDDARHLGLACGDLGAVAPLALLAAAAAQAAQDEAPVLAFGLADPRARVALVLSPTPALDADSATPDSAEAAAAVAATA